MVWNKMNMRRNIVSMLLWFGAAAIFAVHVILQHRKNKQPVEEISERKITQVEKTTILTRTELENIHQVKQTDQSEDDNIEKMSSEDNSGKLSSEVEAQRHDRMIEKREMADSIENLNNFEQHVGGGIGRNYGLHDAGTSSVLQQDGGSGNIQSYLDKAQEEVEKLKAENTRLIERENQFKNLARRLATQLKGREGGLLPKLDPYLPWIFAISPTYARFTQKADLVRLSQTILHVTNFHWILVEDSAYRTDLVSRFLQESGISFTHLNVRTPPKMQRKKGDKHNKHHRGVVQRNLALQWLRDNVDPQKTPGVVYFMDDDNTYHRKIFDEMRRTKRVSIWPVGLAGGAKWSGPIVEKGKVVRFHTNWAPERTFPIDMAGFAVSLDLLVKVKPDIKFDMKTKRGYLEPTFLGQLTTIGQLEPLANNGTKIYVWHTRTEVPKESIRGEKMLMKLGKPSDPSIEV